MTASSGGHEGVVRLLLQRGARRERQNAYLETALHRAVLCDHPRVLALLCAAPPPGDSRAHLLRNVDGRTPLSLAIWHGREECERVLRSAAQASRSADQCADALQCSRGGGGECCPVM